jgi:hypothetical protein
MDVCVLGDKVYVCFDFLECGDCGTVSLFWVRSELSGEKGVCLSYLLFCGGG